MKELPKSIDSKYRFITIAAKRCEMLQKGAKPKIEMGNQVKLTTLAMEEVLQDTLDIQIIEKTEDSGETEE